MAYRRVPLHDFELFFGEAARLEQDVVRRAELAHVVHRCGDEQ